MKKTVLITGCSSGFGKAMCETFAKAGYFVIATARDESKLTEVNAELKLRLDVSDDNSVLAAVSRAYEEAGRIDLLVNNAGYSFRSAIEDIDVCQLREMYEVNVFGMIRMMETVIPIMRQQGGGRIYNIGSISGRMTGLVNGGYCSSKYAVESITEAARYETADMGIEICVIEPGAMDTDFFRTLASNSDEKMKDPSSKYREYYERDLAFRAKQSKSDVSECARVLVEIDKKRKLKVRYTVGVSLVYRVFTKLPDGLKELFVRRFY